MCYLCYARIIQLRVARKTSTTYHLTRKKKIYPTPSDLQRFEQLVNVLKPYEDRLKVRVNSKDHYEVWTNDGYRTTSMHPANLTGIQFAAVKIYSDHITFYLQPLYIHPLLKEQLSENLKPLFKGLSCLHVRDINNEIITDLKDIIKKCWDSYRQVGIIRRD